MPRSTVKLMLAVAAAIANIPVYFLVGMLLERSFLTGSASPWELVAGMVTSVFVCGCWAALWRGSIVWNSRRKVLTPIAFAGCWTITWGISVGWEKLAPSGMELAMFMPLAGVAATLAAMVLVWRETPAELRERMMTREVACAVCGYNLAGLAKPSCPECGTAFTMDQLAAMRKGDEIS